MAALPAGFDYRPGYLLPADAERLFRTLHEELDWRQHHLHLFGRRVAQPRLTAWCSDPGVRYAYSGLRLEPAAWHPALQGLREALNADFGWGFNSVLANLYRDGRDAMGWHSDAEPELGEHPVIASLSLGAVRRFRVRPAGGGPSLGLDLEPGSLLLMSGDSQSRWRHAVPRTRRAVGARINLTFRRVH